VKLLRWLDRLLHGAPEEEAAEPAQAPAGPPPRPGKLVVLTPDVRRAIVGFAESVPPRGTRKPLPEAVTTRLLDFAATGVGLAQLERELREHEVFRGWLRFHLRDLAGLPPMPWEALARLTVAVGTFDPRRKGWGLGHWDAPLARLRREQDLDFDLADVLDLVEATGTCPEPGARELLMGWDSLAAALPVEALAPWFRQHPDVLLEALGVRPVPPDQPAWPSYTNPRAAALVLVEAMDEPPEELREPLWDLALGDAVTHRSQAQRCLDLLPDTLDRVTEAVSHSRQAARAEAAAWLARRGHVAAIPALRDRARRERSDLAREALLTALEFLGESIEDFFDRQRLTRDAYKKLPKLEKRLPDWLVPEVLPEVRWARGGEVVDPVALRYLLARAHKLRSPEPGAGLRRWMARLDSRNRRSLGEALLTHWITADETLGSSVKDKGLLAVVAACLGSQAVEPVRGYLRRWYGQRAPQCKELLRMLGWVEAPEATQLVLEVAARFRTRGIQKVAEEVARDLAERRGWSRAELADRLVPTGGLEAGGTLELDYGSRTLTAFLDDEDRLVVRDEQGKVRRDPPKPRQSDDAEQAEAARKAFSRARKLVRRTLQAETGRLYAAMASERDWEEEAWRRYLVDHPIVGRLVRRLVWELPGSRTARVSAEGTLVDASGAPVSLAPEARVRVAHGTRLDLAVQASWARVFQDAGLRPLLAQFRAAEGVTPPGEREDDGWHGRRGWVLGSYALRSAARKLGYQRGPTGDGGWVHDYRRSLPELGLEVVIEHSGVRLPEDEDVPVALVALRFLRSADEQGGSGWAPPLALSEVPEVLLHEAIADIQDVAASGRHDEDWEARVQG
jgi:hypothetical protein